MFRFLKNAKRNKIGSCHRNAGVKKTFRLGKFYSRNYRMFFIALIFLGATFQNVNFAYPGGRGGEWNKSVQQKLSKRDCAGAWEIVWSEAKAGNMDAREDIAIGTFLGWLVPPGHDSDSLNKFRNTIIFTIFGGARSFAVPNSRLKPSQQLLKKMSTELLTMPAISRLGGQAFLGCIENKKSANSCLAAAVKQGFIPSFDDFAREIDRKVAQGQRASCGKGNKK